MAVKAFHLFWCLVCLVMGEDTLQADLQTMITEISNLTGYAISLGYVDQTHDFGLGAGNRTPQGLPVGPKAGNTTADDTFLLGSGTKPYTAAAIMRLVDQGKLTLDDKVSQHADKPMQAMWNATFVEIMGANATNVTVGNLIRMQAGIADFDIPSYDNQVLSHGDQVHAPLEILKFVAGFKEEYGCKTYNCTYVCEPGTCTMYSSTNFLIAGLVLLGNAPEGQQTWQTYDLAAALNMTSDFNNSHFLSEGKMSEHGLKVGGASQAYGEAEIYSQDASILGWTCGNLAASARDVAKFYWNLLSPYASQRVVSDASLKTMEDWNTLDFGWEKGYLQYGAGLMIQNVNSRKGFEKDPPLTLLASYAGHGGDTYGFVSDNGYFPQLKASISVIVNEDGNSEYPSLVTCQAVDIVAKHLGIKPFWHELFCSKARVPLYYCNEKSGKPSCEFTYHHEGQPKSQCDATCGKSVVQYLMQN